MAKRIAAIPRFYLFERRFTIFQMQFPFKLRENRRFHAAGFGTNAVDYLIRVPEYPSFNTKIELSESHRAPGGEAATTMVALSRLGLRTTYAGRFGDDDAAAIGLSSLVSEGVDVSHCQSIQNAQTQVAFIIIDERSGERTILWKRDAALCYAESEAPIELTEAAGVLHLTPHDADAARRMASAARKAGTIVSLDIDNIFDGMFDLLPLVDVLIASAEFPAKLHPGMDIRPALRAIRERFGSAIVGVTLGEKGSLLLCGEQFIESPGFAAPGGCLDTTGAGDAFRAGLLFGLISGSNLEESCRMANAVAALKCRSIGARTALPTIDELNDFLTESR